jgi:hypothetical protein
MSSNFLHAVFSLLDFLSLEAGTDRLSQNVGTDLTLYTVLISQKSADLTWPDAGHGLAQHGVVQSDQV